MRERDKNRNVQVRFNGSDVVHATEGKARSTFAYPLCNGTWPVGCVPGDKFLRHKRITCLKCRKILGLK